VWQLVDFLTGHTTSFIYLFLFLGLFVGGLGAPIPEDLLLLLGGFLSWAGYTNLYTTIVISIVGALVGDYLVFYIGRKWGSNVLNHPRFRRWLTQRRLKKIHHHFENYGGKTVFVRPDRHVWGGLERSSRYPVRILFEWEDRRHSSHNSWGSDYCHPRLGLGNLGSYSLQEVV
jgi:hypothetical protein